MIDDSQEVTSKVNGRTFMVQCFGCFVPEGRDATGYRPLAQTAETADISTCNHVAPGEELLECIGCKGWLQRLATIMTCLRS